MTTTDSWKKSHWLVGMAGVLLLVSLSGCLYDEVSIDYANGVNVYNFLNKEHPVQTISFETGMPSTFHGVLIDGMAAASYKRAMVGGIPFRRDEAGRIQSLSYHWSDRHNIKFSFDTSQYTMPLSEKQLQHIFGPPTKVDRRMKPH